MDKVIAQIDITTGRLPACVAAQGGVALIRRNAPSDFEAFLPVAERLLAGAVTATRF